MKNIIKLSLLLLMALSALMLLTACSNEQQIPPDEEQIGFDFTSGVLGVIPSNRTVGEIEIIGEETDEEAGLHEVLVKVNSSDRDVSYLEYYALLYMQNEEKEWGLVDFREDRTNTWTKTPLAGVMDESLFRSAIMGMQLSIDGYEWSINEDSLDRITVSNRNTQLEQSRDTVIVDVVLSSAALSAQGQIELEFTFNDSWKNDGQRIAAEFTSEYLPHAVLDMTDERVLDMVTEIRQFVFSSGGTEQNVHLNREQISNITLVQETSSNMGTYKTFEHKLDLIKELVTFEVDVSSTYNFVENSWTLHDLQIMPRVTDVRLDGTIWGGIYRHRGSVGGWMDNTITVGLREFSLSFTELRNIGGLRARLDSTSPDASYSQYLFGQSINYDRLTITIEHEAWIIEPPSSWRSGTIDGSKVSFQGYLNVDDSEIVPYGMVLTHMGFRSFNNMKLIESPLVTDIVDDSNDNGDEE